MPETEVTVTEQDRAAAHEYAHILVPRLVEELEKDFARARQETREQSKDEITRLRSQWGERLKHSRDYVEDLKRHYGFEGCYHAPFRDAQADIGEKDILLAVIDALSQEGVPAWAGDGTSIVAGMIRTQYDARKKVEVELAECRADKQRLDWLLDNSCVRPSGNTGEWIIEWRSGNVKGSQTTFRDCIDAAMKAAEPAAAPKTLGEALGPIVGIDPEPAQDGRYLDETEEEFRRRIRRRITG